MYKQNERTRKEKIKAFLDKKFDLTGQQIGNWLIKKRLKSNQHRQSQWLCQCSCGKDSIQYGSHLRQNRVLACRECSIERNSTHKMTNTRFYHIWVSMKTRCEGKHKFSHRYGGRGIKILWKSFEKFRDEMYKSYLEHVKIYSEKNTTIERIDNNGNYCKENCRWATVEEQQNNRVNNRLLTCFGKTQNVTQWAKEFKLKPNTIRERLKRGWPIKRALLEKIK